MTGNLLSAGFWGYSYFGNTVWEFATAAVALIGFLLVFKIFQSIILNRLKSFAGRTKTDFDDAFVEIIQTLRPPFYSFLALYLSLLFLSVHPALQKGIEIILLVWVVYLAAKAVQILIDRMTRVHLREEEGRATKSAIHAISIIAKIVLWSFGALLVLSNLGIDITSLIAGLGIGGIAIALALQNVLGDLFSSFSIYFDKPFIEGDFIIVGEHMGVVKKIGIKTTRIQALQGEEIVVSNKELTTARVQNFKKLHERRVVVSFGVVYQTPIEKVKAIPGMVREIIEGIEKARFDRAHFHKFDDSALSFEVVYYVQSSEYNTYMDINQDIHFQIKEAFERESIEMAYPTQTIYLEK